MCFSKIIGGVFDTLYYLRVIESISFIVSEFYLSHLCHIFIVNDIGKSKWMRKIYFGDITNK